MAKIKDVTPEILSEILERVALGESIIKVLQSDKERFPQWDYFRKLKRENNEINAQYTRALQDRAIAIEYGIEQYKEMLTNKQIDPATANVLIQANKWQCAKFYPKMFGENMRVSVMDDNEELKSISINIVKTDKID